MNTNGPAPGFVKHPDHQVRITPSGQHWIVRDGDTVLAQSGRALVVEETAYDRVIYFPPEDVSMQRLSQTDDRSTCPFKGEARYFAHAKTDSKQAIAWTYPSVYDEVALIQGYIAFYQDRVNLQEVQADDK